MKPVTLRGKLYLIPTTLGDMNPHDVLPQTVKRAIDFIDCFIVENEKTARRYLKKYWREMVIDNYQWRTIHKAEDNVVSEFLQLLAHGKNIGIIFHFFVQNFSAGP